MFTKLDLKIYIKSFVRFFTLVSTIYGYNKIIYNPKRTITRTKQTVNKYSLPIINRWRKLSPNQQNNKLVKQNEQFFDEYLVSVSATCSYIVNAFSLVACLTMLVNLWVGGSKKIILQNIFTTITAGLYKYDY